MLWVITGVAGSGKSSLASRLAARRGALCLDADDFHPPANIAKMQAGQALNEADREPWLQAICMAIAVAADQEVVLAFPGLRAVHRARLAAVIPALRFAHLRLSPATARQRLEKRGGFFPASLVESQFAALEREAGAFELDAELDEEHLEAAALRWMQAGSVALIGLGRMGCGMAARLQQAGFDVQGFDVELAARHRAAERGVRIHDSIAALCMALPAPRRVLLSLPAGEATASVVTALLALLDQGDLIVDAANAAHADSRRRAAELQALGIGFVDAGVSGGVRGEEAGYAVMAGGSEGDFARALPLLEALAQPAGLVHTGNAGTGHFVKTVHNGIEYGMMQAIAEGAALLQAWPDECLPLADITQSWMHGAVVRSWLLELAHEALAEDAVLSRFKGKVGENATGRWALEAAAERGLAMPALQAALNARAASRQTPSYSSRLLSALRERFGGHLESKQGAL